MKTLKDLVSVVDLLGGSHSAYTTNEISRQHRMPSSLVFLEVDVERPRKPRHLLPGRPLGAWDLQGEEVPVSFSKASSYISSLLHYLNLPPLKSTFTRPILSCDDLFRFLSEVPVTNWAVQ